MKIAVGRVVVVDLRTDFFLVSVMPAYYQENSKIRDAQRHARKNHEKYGLDNDEHFFALFFRLDSREHHSDTKKGHKQRYAPRTENQNDGSVLCHIVNVMKWTDNSFVAI